MTGVMLLFLNVEEKDNGNKTEVRVEISNSEVEEGHTAKLDKYNPSMDIPIALRKCTMSCTKYTHL